MVLHDFKLAFRLLWKTPAFSAAAILTLALGIGVNVAVFTVLHAALLESLPVREPERLVQVYTWTEQGGDHFDFSYPLYVDFRDRGEGLSGLAAYTSSGVGVSTENRSDRTIAEFVTSNYFQVVGIDLAMGPGFTGADELRGGPATAVISHRFWQSFFSADANVLGKRLLINGYPFTITGVVPPEFEGITRGQRVNVWITVPQFFRVRSGQDRLDARTASWLVLLGRLAPGVTSDRAAATLTAMARQLNVINVSPDTSVRLRPAHAGDTGLVENLQTPLELLMIVVGLILVIASANVANLLLARSYKRQQEIAIRQAIGASRSRIVRQLLVEGAVVAFAGGAAGLLLGGWLVALFDIRAPGGAATLALQLDPDMTIVGFAVALSTIAALSAGLLPALSTSRPDLLMVIKGAGDAMQTLVGKRRLRAALVVVQIALSLVLVVGAGLFLRSLSQLRSVDPTLANDRIVAATLNLTLRGYTPERGPQLYEQLLERARAIPGIQSASLAYVLPVTAGGTRMDVAPRTTKPSVDTATSVEIVPVSSGFFQTVGIPLLRGRDFGDADGPNAPHAAIVNETLKRRFWPDMEAVGQSFSIGGTTYEIAGVARDTKYRNLREQPRMTMYLPLAQSYESSANLLVKTAVPVEQTVEALRRELRAIDPALPLYNVRTLAEHVDRSLYLDRLRARLISWLAALALSLAAIGVYGVVSYSVAERTREVGIRLALGAHPRAVLNMILGAGTRLAAIGVLAGLLLSLWLTRLVATELYGVEQMDPLTLIGASALLVAVVALASFVPAWRATRIDPIKALRYE